MNALSLAERLYCAVGRTVLPAELVQPFGRDINETFVDIYRAATGRRARARTLVRELALLFVTGWRERRELRRERRHLLSIRSRPRTPGRRYPGTSPRILDNPMLETLFSDIRYAVRTLRSSPVFAIVSILTLALGIGGNTAVFSVVNTVLLQPLPYEDPEELIVVWTAFGPDLPQNWISGPEYAEIRDLNASMQSFAVMSTDTASLTGDGGDPMQVLQGTVSGTFFDVLRAQPQHGRLFGVDDDDQQRAVAVVTDSFWRSRLGGRDDVVGSTLLLDGAPFEVIGVLSPDFEVHHPNVSDPASLQLFAPMQPTYGTTYQELSRGSHFMLGFGRMLPGMTVAQVQADLDAVAVRMAEIGGYDFEGWGLTVYPLHADLVENSQGALVILLGAVGFVLLIACVNVANLQLTRAASRGREMALRTAVGAGQRRLVQQLLTESLVLAALGAGVGLALASWLTGALAAAAPPGLPRANDIGLDPTVLTFAAAITLLTVLLFGPVPGLMATRTNLVDALKEGGRSASAGRGGARLRTALVVAEVALALVLLVGAGLLLRSFSGLLNDDPGYRTDSVLTMRVSLPSPKYDANTTPAFWDELLTKIRALPGVERAGAINSLPLSGYGGSGTTLAERSDSESVDTWQQYKYIEADRRYVSEDYFETMEARLVAGRTFDASDQAGATPVAVVDETFARRFWGNDDPLGERIAINWTQAASGHGFDTIEWREVVGVIKHVRHRDLGSVGREQAYVPLRQGPRFGMHVAVRVDGEPAAVAGSVREQVWNLDPEQPIADIATMTERVSRAVATPRFNSILLSGFAAVALLLSAIGIYGVVSYSVGQRTGEIGVRMALGATRGSVRSMVLRQGLAVVVVGLGLGLAAAFGLTRLITSMLYAVSPTDPLTFVAVAAVLAVVAMVACFIPARRATRVEPVLALRDD